VACGPIYLFGSDYLKETFLKPLAAGRKIGAFALTEPDAGSDPASQKTRAVKSGASYVLNGNKTFISTGKNADLTVVTAYTSREKRHRGISAFVVEKGTPGFYVGKEEEKMGLCSSDTVELIFEDCRIPGENLLGREGDGFIIAMTSLDGGRIGIASQSVGLAQACLDASISYAKERVQFGRPIAQFQGLRWIIADMATEVEAARLLTFQAAAMKDSGENFTAAASMAKVFASEMANRVAYQALQIHGGYGYIKDFPVERYYRDARVFTLYEGTSEIQREVISKHLIGK
jgi:alkylation response protein AidB-like acyl-CoA dehydrogenase